MRPVDIQNATLAGGVSIGCVANLTLNPAVAIFIGICASLVATAGSYYVQPYLEEKFSIHDTCGVHNLHGMTSIVGGIVSIIVAAVNVDQDSGIYNVDGKDYAEPMVAPTGRDARCIRIFHLHWTHHWIHLENLLLYAQGCQTIS